MLCSSFIYLEATFLGLLISKATFSSGVICVKGFSFIIFITLRLCPSIFFLSEAMFLMSNSFQAFVPICIKTKIEK